MVQGLAVVKRRIAGRQQATEQPFGRCVRRFCQNAQLGTLAKRPNEGVVLLESPPDLASSALAN